ncbi:MAG: M48 family metallopeptidase [Chromatiales bacterium]|nr:M48 family metallopeptidase [Chromatiales bacterium]
MVKRLFNKLFSTHTQIGSSDSSQSFKLQLSEHSNISIKLIRTRRKKSIAFRISNNQIKIFAPKRLALYRIQKLLEKRSEWISQQLEYQASLVKALPKQYVSGELIRYLGRRYRINISSSTEQKQTTLLKAGQLMIALPDSHKSQDNVKEALGQWYQQRAEKRLPEIVSKLSKEIGVDYGDIEIRHFKSRWGSCRADGRLQFNWRIMMAPSQVIEYVAVHELCHRIHLNHSTLFWDTVERQMPKYRAHRKWLKEHGYLLTL